MKSIGYIITQLLYSALYLTLTVLFGLELAKPLPQCGYNEDTFVVMFNKDQDISKQFKVIYILGFVIYLVETLLHLCIVFGLLTSRFYFQLFGITVKLITASVLQTGLVLIMPVFRYSTGGNRCSAGVLQQ